MRLRELALRALGPVGSFLVASRRLEFRRIGNLAAGRVAALAELVRLSRFEESEDPRLLRSVRFMASGAVGFAGPEQTTRWHSRLHPDIDLVMEGVDSRSQVPLGAVETLIRECRPEPIQIEVSDDGSVTATTVSWAGVDVDFSLYSAFRLAMTESSVRVDCRTSGMSTVVLSVDRDMVGRRINEALAAAAAHLGLSASAFSTSERDPATLTALSDESVHKIRFMFMYSRRVATLRDEWMTLERLRSHPGVVKAESYRSTHDWELLTTKRIHGEPLGAVALGLDPLSPQAFRHLLCVMDTAFYLERRGIVHRDFVPHNLIVSDDGRPYLLDFDESVVVDPRDGPLDVGTMSHFRPLVPWAHHRELIDALGWSKTLVELDDQLEGVWEASGAHTGLELWSRLLPGTGSFWSRWHAVASISKEFRGQRVGVLGEPSGLVAVLLAVNGVARADMLDVPVAGPALGRLVRSLGVEGLVAFGGDIRDCTVVVAFAGFPNIHARTTDIEHIVFESISGSELEMVSELGWDHRPLPSGQASMFLASTSNAS